MAVKLITLTKKMSFQINAVLLNYLFIRESCLAAQLFSTLITKSVYRPFSQ